MEFLMWILESIFDNLVVWIIGMIHTILALLPGVTLSSTVETGLGSLPAYLAFVDWWIPLRWGVPVILATWSFAWGANTTKWLLALIKGWL